MLGFVVLQIKKSVGHAGMYSSKLTEERPVVCVTTLLLSYIIGPSVALTTGSLVLVRPHFFVHISTLPV